MVGLQEISDLSKIQTDLPYYGVFRADETPVNSRNMYWVITLLRVLQMLTKHKPHRIMLMSQYKSAVILKRLLKVYHPTLEEYVLKLLKSQVPYLGKKWRSRKLN